MLTRMLVVFAGLLVAAEMTPPSLVPESKTEPKYTQEALDAKFQGNCLLEIGIDSEGFVTEAKVLKHLGYGLDENAMDAVRQWRFHPATRDGKPVATAAKVEVNFRLKEKEDQ